MAVDEMSVVAYQGVLTEGRFLGASVTEFVSVIVARVIYFTIGLDVRVEAHGPVEAGEVGPDGGRSGVLHRLRNDRIIAWVNFRLVTLFG